MTRQGVPMTRRGTLAALAALTRAKVLQYGTITKDSWRGENGRKNDNGKLDKNLQGHQTKDLRLEQRRN